MAKYNVGEAVPFVFDTAPNIAGLTDMQMHGIDVVNDTDLASAGGALYDVNVLINGSSGVVATELANDAGTYKHMINGLAAGTYLLWMSSFSNGATSNKVLVTVAASSAGDPFFGKALA